MTLGRWLAWGRTGRPSRPSRVALVTVAGLTSALAAGPASARLLQDVKPSPAQQAQTTYDELTPAQRVGQLFMAALPSSGATAAQLTALRAKRIDNVILVNASSSGRTAVGAATDVMVGNLTESGVSPFISTDQEGGEVQRLTGPGFEKMPTALAQGRMTSSALRSAATTWGKELAGAGVTLDLAPVADTVPKKDAKTNQPIGIYHREYGHTPAVVGPHVVAFIKGMTAADVDTTVKHFPGLGRATGNTDTTAGVTDPTGPHSTFLEPFQDAITAGAQFVMVSSATYPKIDPNHLACFSKTIIGGMLRGTMKFTGVVISDDLGTVALRKFPVGTRAVDFFKAGGTMLLDTTLGQIRPMVKAVVAEQAASPAFAKQIKTDVLDVLTAKAAAHLIAS
ncbi:MAG TPA: glycoside hydrolase family 3 N-terminal domain-containing protein [Mycobacteriales bacterium]|nr:glycoside hydrolase family 3 N-terminal domain-containing protein [Mycobacteriales bacterium]